MTTQINPYQPPEVEQNARATQLAKPVEFCGTISVEEAEQIDDLVKPAGKITVRRRNSRGQRSVWLSAVLIGGYLAFESIRYYDFEELLEVFLGLTVVIVTFLVVAVQPLLKRRNLEKARAEGKGMFVPLRGEFGKHGVTFSTESNVPPIEYPWDQFVGFRMSDQVAVLYLRYPDQVNPITRSCFSSAADWELVRTAIQNHLQRIPANPRRSRFQPGPIQALMIQGSDQLAREKWKAANETLTKLLELDPMNIHALRGHASSTCITGDFAASLRSAEMALSQASEDEQMRRIRATSLIGLERFQDAVEALTDLLDAAPTDTDLLAQRCRALVGLNRFDQANEDAKRMLAMNPDCPIALNNRGRCLVDLGQPAAAIPLLQSAIKLAPHLPNPREHLARAETMVAESEQTQQEER